MDQQKPQSGRLGLEGHGPTSSTVSCLTRASPGILSHPHAPVPVHAGAPAVKPPSTIRAPPLYMQG